MRKTYSLAYLSLIAFISLFVGCKGKSVPPVSERIAKVWTASQVEENSTIVYKRGATSNIRPTYTNWKLDLSTPTTYKYTEFDGNTFTGQYSLPDDQTLQLTGITTSGDGGTITFVINSIDDNNLKLTRTTTSQKTGGKINVYTLTNP